MKIYNFNLITGYEKTGIDFAQSYRYKLLSKLGYDLVYIFSKLPSRNDINKFIELGHNEDTFIFAHLTLTTLKNYKPVLSFEEALNFVNVNKEEAIIEEFDYEFKVSYKNNVISFYKTSDTSNIIYKISYFSNFYLIRSDYLSHKIMYSEYFSHSFINDIMHASLQKRVFFNEDSSIAYEEIIKDNNSTYIFNDEIIYNEEHFYKKFIQSLNLSSQDIIILDRYYYSEFLPALLKLNVSAKIGAVMHSAHYFIFSEELYYEYYYLAKYIKSIDFIIASTELQANSFKNLIFEKYNHNINVFTLPVGSLQEKVFNNDRYPLSITTASRLVPNKNIDILIEAVSLAKKEIPNLVFDIYGDGMDMEKLNQLIIKLGATDFIKLKGFADLPNIFSKYQLYITASESETLGLTLMEAVGSGLPIIGLDVVFGNPTFVDHGSNGYLVPWDSRPTMAKELSKKIIKFFKENKYEQFSKHSYTKANDFLSENIAKNWVSLINEVTNN